MFFDFLSISHLLEAVPPLYDSKTMKFETMKHLNPLSSPKKVQITQANPSLQMSVVSAKVSLNLNNGELQNVNDETNIHTHIYITKVDTGLNKARTSPIPSQCIVLNTEGIDWPSDSNRFRQTTGLVSTVVCSSKQLFSTAYPVVFQLSNLRYDAQIQEITMGMLQGHKQ